MAALIRPWLSAAATPACCSAVVERLPFVVRSANEPCALSIVAASAAAASSVA